MPVCAFCGGEHEEVEPGFCYPDAWYAVPEAERATRISESSDFVSIDDEAFFIRCVVPIPVLGRAADYCWGFWVKVSARHYQEHDRYFRDDPPPGHEGFGGTLANQTKLLRPTLGLRVHVHLGRGTARPRVMLLDEHELTAQQAHGVSEQVVHAWSETISGRPAPLDPPRKETSLDEEGWLVARPAQVGRPVHHLATLPKPGDFAKAPFVFLAADAHGTLTERVEYMWVKLEELAADGWWRGALNNRPFVPGPIGGGSPVWLRAEHLLAFEAAAT